jgi:hypothetical protein
MHVAYADPPYIGQAKRHYARFGGSEVDHTALIAQLMTSYPDGWALSCSSPTLGVLLPLCPTDIRVGAWVKPFCAFKVGVNPAYAWEPVLFRGGRKRPRTEPTVRDWVSANITLKRGMPGAKPEAFCRWLFDLLGLLPEDTLDDLFPGSGAVTTAWEQWRAERRPHARAADQHHGGHGGLGSVGPQHHHARQQPERRRLRRGRHPATQHHHLLATARN